MACECKRDRRWPCFDKDLPGYHKNNLIYETKALRSISPQASLAFIGQITERDNRKMIYYISVSILTNFHFSDHWIVDKILIIDHVTLFFQIQNPSQ